MTIKTYSSILPYVKISPEQPNSVPQEIWERIVILFCTRPGTQALDREYGILWPVDELTPIAQALAEQEVTLKMRRYIDGVDIRETIWNADAEGRLQMEVIIYDVR